MASSRPTRRLLTAIAAAGLLALAACSSDDDASSATTRPDDVRDEEGETQIPLVPDPSEERDFGIAGDARAADITGPAQEHFGDRWAGVSFDIPEGALPVMHLHLVEPTDADRAWVRDLVGQVDPDWAELVEVVEAERSLDELRDLLEAVLGRAGELGVAVPVQLDLAGNRVLVADVLVEPGVRAQLREGLPDGSVVFPDEIEDEDEDDGAE